MKIGNQDDVGLREPSEKTCAAHRIDKKSLPLPLKDKGGVFQWIKSQLTGLSGDFVAFRYGGLVLGSGGLGGGKARTCDDNS